MVAILFSPIFTRAADPIFTDVTGVVAPNLPQVGGGVSWADFDNNGRLGFVLGGALMTNVHNPDGSGSTYPVYLPPLWRNTGSVFTNVATSVAGLPSIS